MYGVISQKKVKKPGLQFIPNIYQTDTQPPEMLSYGAFGHTGIASVPSFYSYNNVRNTFYIPLLDTLCFRQKGYWQLLIFIYYLFIFSPLRTGKQGVAISMSFMCLKREKYMKFLYYVVTFH